MKDHRVSISTGTLFSGILVAIGVYLLWLLRDLLLLILTAIVIASAIEPPIAFFVRQKLPRFVSVVLVYVLAFGSIFALVYFLFPPIVGDAAEFFSTMPKYLDTLNLSNSFPLTTGAHSIFQNGQGESLTSTLFSLQSLFSATTGGAARLLVTFFGGIFSLFLVIVLSFYFALLDTGVDDFLRLIMPAKYEAYTVDLWRRSQKKIGLWMQGQVLLSVIVAILVYLGLMIVGVPYALLLAVFTAVAEIIPIFGSIIAGTIAVIVAYSTGGVPLGLIVAGLYVVVNQFESNLIYPLIVKKIVGVPPLLVIVALIAGYTLAGPLGAVLSVPVAAVVLEGIYDFDKRKHSHAS